MATTSFQKIKGGSPIFILGVYSIRSKWFVTSRHTLLVGKNTENHFKVSVFFFEGLPYMGYVKL